MWRNTETRYGLIAKVLHWGSALTVVGLFAAGYWMVDLSYYSSWYKTAPHWHKSIGILLLIFTVFRLLWRLIDTKPLVIESHSNVVQLASKMGHFALYALLFVLMISGYLISTADGRSIDVFNLFSVAALGELFSDQADIAGLVHEYVAYSLIALSLLHGLAAIKHHVIDKDETLKRMTMNK